MLLRQTLLHACWTCQCRAVMTRRTWISKQHLRDRPSETYSVSSAYWAHLCPTCCSADVMSVNKEGIDSASPLQVHYKSTASAIISLQTFKASTHALSSNDAHSFSRLSKRPPRSAKPRVTALPESRPSDVISNIPGY